MDDITGGRGVEYLYERIQKLGDEDQGIMPTVCPALNDAIPTRLCSTP